MKPEAILKQMVTQAKEKYAAYNLTAKAKELNLQEPAPGRHGRQSLVQAEGKTQRRLPQDGRGGLQPSQDHEHGDQQAAPVRLDLQLPEGPEQHPHQRVRDQQQQGPVQHLYAEGAARTIGNPGDDAIKATLNPTSDGWVYFVATDGQSDAEFAKTYAEFQKLKDKFNESWATDARRAAVLGSPIAHPLPGAAPHRVRELGLGNWSYDRFEIDEAALPGFSGTWVPSGRVCR